MFLQVTNSFYVYFYILYDIIYLMLKNILAGILILISLLFLKITYNTEIYTKERLKKSIPQYMVCYSPPQEVKVIENIFDCPAK